MVEAEGPPDAEPPAAAAGLSTSVRRTALGTTRFTVPESHSDVLLGSLLGARPPWHVVSVSRAHPKESAENVVRPLETEGRR